MKKQYLILFGMFFISCSNEKENYVLNTKSWKEGEVIKYWVTIDEFLVTGNGMIPKNNIRYETDLSILKISDSIEVFWQQYFPNSIKGNSSLLDSLSGDTINFMKGLQVKYLLTKKGEIAKIKNWTEIEDYVTHTIDTLFKTTNSKLSPTETEELKQKMISWAKNRKQIAEGKTTKDHQIFHGIYGINIPIKDSVEFVKYTIMGQHDTMRVSFLGQEGDYLHFMLTSTIKNCKFDSSVIQLMNEMAEAIEEPFDLANRNINISDTCYVMFDKLKGIPVLLRSVRWTEMDSFKSLSQYKFELK